MTVLNEPLLIASAPDHVLIGLGLFFACTAIFLLFQAVEQGIYPELRGCVRGLLRRVVRRRERRQRWVHYTFAGEWVALSA